MSLEASSPVASAADAPLGPADAGARRAALLEALDVVDSGPEERFERITRIAREVFGVSGSFLNLAGDSTLTIKSQQIDEPIEQEWRLADTFCGRTLGEDAPVVIPDARADERYADLGFVTGDLQIRFYAGAPLRVGERGEKIGTLCLIDQQPRTLRPDEIELLEDLARWAQRELEAGVDRDRLRAIVDGMAPEAQELPGYRIAGLSIPHALISGDYHDWSRTGDGAVFTLADVMGKGMAAGLLASGIRGALRARVDAAPDVAVAELEAQIAPELGRAEAFATLFHGHLSARSGRVDFVDAGHGLALHLRADGSDSILRSLDLPIGLHPSGSPRASSSLVLAPGDALLIASDGVLELWDSTLASLVELGRLFRGADGVEAFFDLIRERTAADDPGDDVTVLVIIRAES